MAYDPGKFVSIFCGIRFRFSSVCFAVKFFNKKHETRNHVMLNYKPYTFVMFSLQNLIVKI